MEEQPKDRAQDRPCYQQQHGADRSSSQQRAACVKHDQSHVQRQHPEATKKKTGVKKVNVSDEEGEKYPRLSDTVVVSHPASSSVNRHLNNANVKQRGTQKFFTSVPRASSKLSGHKKSMDYKNDKEKAAGLSPQELLDKRDSALLQNGVVNCGLVINGYSSKDNDGSGSEGGYTTPKKRKARCNIAKNTDNVTRDKDMQPRNTTHELGALNLEAAEKRATHKVEAQPAAKRTVASETSLGESQRKNSDGKTAGTFGKRSEERHKGKLSSPSKEDSWTLFKPPPVFPVDNSSAKIVPKISYASKVKENLNKVAQTGEEVTPLPPVRLTQVPMSAMKTISSASFTNGPVSGNGNGCPSSGTFFVPAASVQSAPCVPSGENVASLESNCSSTTSPVDGDASELKKCALLVYPLNMQPVLPSARHLDPPAAQTNQKALGDIFQNQWGLSFINEPNLGLEGGNVPAEDQTPATSRHESQTVGDTVAQPFFNVSPSLIEPGALSQDPEKRTCGACQVSNACSPCVVGEEEAKLQENQKAELEGAGCCGSAASKDNGAAPAQGQHTTVLFGSPTEQSLTKDRRCSWGSFDVKAAVAYHTKEMEFVFNLQKQDPKRVVVYDETKDGPDH